MGRVRRVYRITASQLDQMKLLAEQGKNKNQSARILNLAPGTIYGQCRRNGWVLAKSKRRKKREPQLEFKTPRQPKDKTSDQILELLAAQESGALSRETFALLVKKLVT